MKNKKSVFRDTNAIKFILLNILLFIALARFSLIFSNNQLIYIVPFCALPLIIRSFYDLRLALFVYTITIVLVGWLAQHRFILFYSTNGGNSFCFNYRKSLQTIRSICVSVKNCSCLFNYFLGISLITKGDIFGQDYIIYGYLIISAFLTLFSYQLVYVYEKLFSLVSDVSLLELTDTNHPILKEMAEKAPGTFQHSIQVSNLAEQAIMEIGGNVLLVRAGAMYHDIGKMNNPLFFIENQMAGVNPHDELSADESAKIIISHVIKGIEKEKNSIYLNKLLIL